MASAGTQDLAIAFATAATHFAAVSDQALWLVADDGSCLASGGAVDLDAGIRFVRGRELSVDGLAAERGSWLRRCDLPAGESVWLVLTAPSTASEAPRLLVT